MAQLSRPFQVVIVVFLLAAGVLLFTLQSRSTSPSTSGTGTAPAVSSSSTARKAAASHSSASAAAGEAGGSHVYHGPVPGLEGLTRDVNRAHKAVAQAGEAPQAPRTSTTSSHTSASSPHASVPSQPSKHPTASSVSHSTTAKPATPTASAKAATPTTTAKPATPTTASAKAATPTSSATAKAPASTAHKTQSAVHPVSDLTAPAGQRSVEAQLAKGDVVVLLFWNPKGTEDVSVQAAVHQLQKGGHAGAIAVQQASASQVASYGSVTRGVQVNATPTIFIINKQHQAIVLTGLQDVFSIEQAIEEARQS
jgi:hypothetical protein